MMPERTRFVTTLQTQQLRTLRHIAANNGSNVNKLLDKALESFLSDEYTKVAVLLPKEFVRFLEEYSDKTLEDIASQSLAMEVFVAFENGEISKEEATKICKSLGFGLDGEPLALK